jgi:ferredoxin
VKVVFVDKDGKRFPTVGRPGQSLLELAHAHAVDLEGACEASLACSTCHVVLDDKVFAALPEPSEEEQDMLDLAWGLTDTCVLRPWSEVGLHVSAPLVRRFPSRSSRLGCQVRLLPEHDGMEVRLPAATRNFYVDGHKPKPH